MVYADDLSIREARELYFKLNGFDASTYTDRWVRLPVGRFTLLLPNLEGRKRAVPLHDIDHVLTEYQTNWLGEFEISAYELGTGCGRYWAGWGINMQGAAFGFLRAPRALVRAFARGRRSEGVFGYSSEQPLLDRRVGELRRETTSPRDVSAGLTDWLLLTGWFVATAVLHLAPLALLIAWLR